MIDWQKIALDLRRELGSERAVAERTGLHQGTISRYCTKRTTSLSYENGIALLSLHNELLGARWYAPYTNALRMIEAKEAASIN